MSALAEHLHTLRAMWDYLGRKVEENCARCPRTTRMLTRTPIETCH